MTIKPLVFFVLCLAGLAACSPEPGVSTQENLRAYVYFDDFMKSCQSRREYARLRRAGKLEAHCACIFDKTMKDLSSAEQTLAAFYLYGEKNAQFTKNHMQALTPQQVTEAMNPAAIAIRKAKNSCP